MKKNTIAEESYYNHIPNARGSGRFFVCKGFREEDENKTKELMREAIIADE
ncbi:hypothetical protein [Paenibacillus humicus]|uniref:hypothetical protein n=1 Tax=Paenibacillus humicus TaxID=412861 RepID=UPI001C3FE736|nr:hypothetical protein [Paenibacillus humicus]